MLSEIVVLQESWVEEPECRSCEADVLPVQPTPRPVARILGMPTAKDVEVPILAPAAMLKVLFRWSPAWKESTLSPMLGLARNEFGYSSRE